MIGLTRLVLRHKLLIVLFWLIITLVGFSTINRAINALSFNFSAPGEEGYETNQAILHNYGMDGDANPVVLVATLPPGTTMADPAARAQLSTALDKVAAAVPRVRILSYLSTNDQAFHSKDGRTTYALLSLPFGLKQGSFGDNGPTVKLIQQTVKPLRVAGAPIHVTGIDALSSSEGSNSGPSLLVEALTGGLGALIVLAFVFGSFLALVPLIMAIVAIPTTFLIVWGLTTVTEISFIVEFLVTLIGLGVAIDYALLIIVRWREERAAGYDNEEAIVRAMSTAGHAVVFSATAVAIGLLAMVALPIPALRSVGYGSMLIPLVSLVVALTLLPVVMATIGTRLDWPRLRSEAHVSHLWSGWAHVVVRRRWIAAAAAVIVLGVLLSPVFRMNVGNPAVTSLAKSGDAHDGLVALEQSGIGSGPLTPISLLVKQGDPTPVITQVVKVDGVRTVVAPADPEWRQNGTSLITVVPSTDANTTTGTAIMNRVRDAAHGASAYLGVGGNAAASADFTSAVYGNFPLMIGIIVVITYVLLARAFRSLILPLKALVMDVLSIGAAWGVMTFVFQDGHGSQQIWGITPTGALTSWVPLFVFAFLFGLSMDYEVFLLSRMREEYDATGSTDQAVVTGLGRTGRLVTGGALILFLSFVSLSTVPTNDVKVLATGLAVGILLDATIVRAILVPALVSLMGHWNWWLPAWPARLLRVRPSVPVTETAASD